MTETFKEEFDRLEKTVEQSPNCEWSTEENTDWWQSGCGEEWAIPNGTPQDNDMRFCPMCGKKLITK